MAVLVLPDPGLRLFRLLLVASAQPVNNILHCLQVVVVRAEVAVEVFLGTIEADFSPGVDDRVELRSERGRSREMHAHVNTETRLGGKGVVSVASVEVCLCLF